MSDTSDRDDIPPTPVDDPGANDDVNSTGSDVGNEDIPWAAVDSGQSDDIQSPLTAQGVADREQVGDADRSEQDEIDADEAGLA